VSCIENEEFAADIKLHLQSQGKYSCAMNIVNYLEDPVIQKWHGLKKTVSLLTAQRWLHKLGYRWKKEKCGQYSDGHECSAVEYSTMSPGSRYVVVWFHDESTFYANDCHKVRWEHVDEDALPQPKGDGAAIMVAHFVSADYRFLQSPDGKESARILFRAGKSRDGYYSSNDILKQATQAMDILEKHFPGEDHIFIFDNATTHLKHAENALSACHMPKNPSKSWGP
ncbi:hypothetical protein PISMIDRAFT_32293, partial [Pisolithus microcarpus 441]